MKCLAQSLACKYVINMITGVVVVVVIMMEL